MKKALFLTSLLAGVAVAETPSIGATADPTKVNYTSQVAIGNSGKITATSNHGGKELTMTPPTYDFVDGDGNSVGYIGETNAINSDVGDGGSFVATFHFPVSGATHDSYTISNVTVNFGFNNDEGTTYPLESYLYANNYYAPTVTITYTIIDEQGEEVWTNSKDYIFDDYHSTMDSVGLNVSPEVSLTGNFDLRIQVDYKASETQLSEAEQAEINELVKTANWDETQYMGDKSLFYSIDTIDISGNAPLLLIPEPTTATLSLLALAGLAARRRRK